MERLYKYIEDENITLLEDKLPVKDLKGLYFKNTIIIDSEIETNNERVCVLAEEIGHHETSCGVILNQKNTNNIKQEKRARKWAYQKMLPLEKLVMAYKAGCKNRYEIAEYLEITEDFLEESIRHYKETYGILKKIDNYVVYLDPLGVMEIY